MSQRLTPLEIMTKLVSFPTVSTDSNIALIDWVDAYLTEHGVETGTMDHPTDPKKALFAHAGPRNEGGIVLSGHTDVVPVDGQEWTSDPWEVVQKDGKLYGRGCCDMKGFDALAIWAIVEAHQRGVSRPLQLALSYDEEIGCTGAAPLIEAMNAVLPKASAVLVGEPSMMKTVTAHKGGIAWNVHMQGFEVHSSLLHTGVNAIMFGAKLIDWVNHVNAESQAATPSDVAAIFEPPWTTGHVGQISGGTAHNITAKDCQFGVDFRVLPDEDPEEWRRKFLDKVAEVEAEMQAIVPDTKIALGEKFGLPGLAPETDGMAEILVRSITGDNGEHVVSYGTEAGHFQAAGYSAVVCGPGNIAQAHQPDEYISTAQFNAGHQFMNRLLDML